MLLIIAGNLLEDSVDRTGTADAELEYELEYELTDLFEIVDVCVAEDFELVFGVGVDAILNVCLFNDVYSNSVALASDILLTSTVHPGSCTLSILEIKWTSVIV